MINYRTVADLNAHIVSALPKVPRNIDLVVGIPRSGFLAGSLFALHLNCALTDVRGFLENRIMSFGLSRGGFRFLKHVSDARAVLVVDDSIFSGKQMTQVRARLADVSRDLQVYYAAVYALPESKHKVDIYCNICPAPRIFEWNLMHDNFLVNACVDMDGILCCDPTEEQNDDGSKYLDFLQNVKPLLLPTTPIGYIVTCRLEKYRIQTEEWLSRHEVKYKNLVMMDLPSKKARIEAGNHAGFKAKACKKLGATFFLESDLTQALEIARLAEVDVFCAENREFINPTSAQLIVKSFKSSPRALRQTLQKIIRKTANFIIYRVAK